MKLKIVPDGEPLCNQVYFFMFLSFRHRQRRTQGIHAYSTEMKYD